MPTLQISKEQLSQLYDFAEKNLPNEAAALLFGICKSDTVEILHIALVENESDSATTSFAVNPEVQYRLLIEAEERGEEMVAIFHSHPAPTRPSTKDLRFMKLNPVVWLIASKISGSWDCRAFVLENNAPLEVPIIVLPL